MQQGNKATQDKKTRKTRQQDKFETTTNKHDGRNMMPVGRTGSDITEEMTYTRNIPTYV
jgi:hypothetical protein